MTGLPALARLMEFAAPRDDIKLADLLDADRQCSGRRQVSPSKTAACWQEFMKVLCITTLPRATTEKFLAYRDYVMSRKLHPATVSTRCGKIKTVIRFGLSQGMDGQQIRAALDRAAVLVTTLNLAMYPSDVLSVNWDELDLSAGTYVAARGRGQTGVVRVGALWRRTIEALPRKPGRVFQSESGDGYVSHTLRKMSTNLRTKAGVSGTVEFNQIRDGAYSAACSDGVPFHLARILPGHRQRSESDHYVARQPRMVQPAVDAIERVYFGEGSKGVRK